LPALQPETKLDYLRTKDGYRGQLISCFAAVAICFTLSTLIAEYGGFRIRFAARTIATDSAPSQRHLGVMRTDLRHLMALVYRCAAQAHPDDSCQSAPPVVLADLDQHWASYLRLPSFPGENAGWAEAEAQLRALHATVPERFPIGSGSKLLSEIDSHIEALDASLVALIQINLDHEDLLSTEIQTVGGRIGTLALVMDVIGLLFATGMGFIALRIVQRYTRKREETLSVLSLRDELTGLYNRRGLFRKAIEQIDNSRRHKQRLLLVFADLDDLKAINDRLGHALGDKALVETATLLRQTFRASDVLARLGGDEFVALSLADGPELADSLRERLAENLERHNARPDRLFHLGISVGMAWYEPETSETLERLLRRADSAMYREKRERRGLEERPSRVTEP
jgi:diguanylate cyclase (GGDEF)-like protein